MSGKNRSDNIEKDKRVRMVFEWLLMDYPKSDIMANCIAKWGVSERQASRYIAVAYEQICEVTEKDKEKRVNYHVQRRMKLLRGLDESIKKDPKGARTALHILKDIAALEGLYKENTELTKVKIIVNPTK